MKLKITLKALDKIAHDHGWARIDHQENIGMASYEKVTKDGPARINVYMTRMTVATIVNHPKDGRNQMFRKRVSQDLLKKIFANPRSHTPLGYRKKVHAR